MSKLQWDELTPETLDTLDWLASAWHAKRPDEPRPDRAEVVRRLAAVARAQASTQALYMRPEEAARLQRHAAVHGALQGLQALIDPERVEVVELREVDDGGVLTGRSGAAGAGGR